MDPVFATTVGHTGSSTLMKMFGLCGAWTGKCMEGNGREYYENYALVRINRDIVRGVYGNWDINAVYDEEFVENMRIEFEKSIKDQGYEEGPIIFKDPHLTLTFPFWDMVYPEARWIIITRPLSELIVNKNDKGDVELLKAWDKIQRKNSRKIHCSKKFVVRYSELLEEFSHLLEFCGLAQDKSDEARAYWEPKPRRREWSLGQKP